MNYLQDHNRRDMQVRVALVEQARDDAYRREKRLRALIVSWRNTDEGRRSAIDCADELEAVIDS